jgi:hypothetical protein
MDQIGGGATPTTVVGAFIFIAVSLLATVIWIVKTQFSQADKMLERLDKNTEQLAKVAMGLERLLIQGGVKKDE